MRYLIPLLLVCLIGLTFTGCNTDTPENPPPLSRERILRVVDLGELGVNLLLGFAETRGQDVTQARGVSESAFTLARSTLDVDFKDISKEGLEEALRKIKIAGNDALALCAAAGVDSANISRARIYLQDAYVVLESLIQWLPDKG